jgi:hypothetical protein
MSFPFIWSVIQINQNGALMPLVQGDTTQIFPTYFVYRNGSKVQTITQTSLLNFIPLTWTSFYPIP